MEEQKKTLKISLKTAILIFFIILILILCIIAYIYSNTITEECYEDILECYEDINADENDEYIKVKCNTRYVKVPKDIADDTGKRSNYTIYINDKKILEDYGDVTEIKAYDYDLDGKNEIILTLDAREWPSFCMYALVYKLENNTLKKIDQFEKYTYYIYNINDTIRIDTFYVDRNNKTIEIRKYNNFYNINLDNKLIYTSENFVNDFNLKIKTEDLDNDRDTELLLDNKILKFQNDELKVYADEEFFYNSENIDLNIFETSCDLDKDGVIDNVKIKQAIKNKEDNKKEFLYTDLYINNIKPQAINVHSIGGPYEILSVENDKLNDINIIIVSMQNIYTGEIQKEGIRLDYDRTAIGI